MLLCSIYVFESAHAQPKETQYSIAFLSLWYSLCECLKAHYVSAIEEHPFPYFLVTEPSGNVEVRLPSSKKLHKSHQPLYILLIYGD